MPKFAGWLNRLLGRAAVPRVEGDELSTAVTHVQALAPSYVPGAVVDPVAIAHRANIGTVEALAALRVLERRGQGRFILRVVNASGAELRRFDSIDEIGNVVEGDFGESVTVMPENIDLAFSFTAHGKR